MNLKQWIELNEFLFYLVIGTIATLIDWCMFYVFSHQIGWHYEAALAFGFCTAAIFHYFANKVVTFKCHSTELEKQLPLYLFVMVISLVCNMIIMAAIVKLYPLPKVMARITTTIIMIVPNYLLHKHITFSKRIFTPLSAR